MVIKVPNYSQENCSECGGLLVQDKITGDTLCSGCGLVIRERSIETSRPGKVYRASNKDDFLNFVPKLVDLSFATFIPINFSHGTDFNRIIRVDRWPDHVQKFSLNVSTEIKRIASLLHLPEYLLEEASSLAKKAQKEGLCIGRTVKGMIAACLLYSIRKNNIPITLNAIERYSDEKRKMILHCYKALIMSFSLRTSVIDLVSIATKYCSDLELDAKFQAVILKLLNEIKEKGNISGKDPRGYCAGMIYHVTIKSGLCIYQKRIAEIVGVTPATLRYRFREIRQFFNKKTSNSKDEYNKTPVI